MLDRASLRVPERGFSAASSAREIAHPLWTTVRRSWWAGRRRELALLLLVAVCGIAGAQTVQFAGYETTLPLTGSSSPQPLALAVDASGDVFVSDMANDAVVKLTPSGNSYVQSTVADSSTGLASPRGIALDGSGNLYIADFGGHQLYKLPWTGSAFGSPVPLLNPGSYSPADVAVDQLGYAFFTNWGDTHVYAVSTNGGSAITESQFTGLAQPLGLLWQQTGPSTGNLFVSDYSGNAVVESAWTGGPSWGAATTVPTSGLLRPARLTLDSSGNLYIADSGNNRVVEVPWSGSAWQAQMTVRTSTLSGPQAVTADSSGNLYVADSGNGRVLKENFSGSYSFGTVPVGTKSSAVTLFFRFTADATVGSMAVRTQGATGLDFAAASGGTCMPGSYLLGDVCSVNATFAPQRPGARLGAVVFEDGSGNVLGQAYLSGVGQGPAIAFAPVSSGGAPLSESTLAVSGSPTPQPAAIAVDASGNVYVSDSVNMQVLKEKPAGNSYTQTAVPSSGLVFPGGVAVDGAGNVYIADFGGQQLYMAQWKGSGYGASLTPLLTQGMYVPAGVAVDGSGNVFFTSKGSSDVYEIAPGGALTVLSQFSAFASPPAYFQPAGVALDAAGNLFVSYYNYGTGGEVAELPWNGSAWAGSAVPAISVSSPASYSGIAIDAGENIYIADSQNNTVLKAQWNGSGWSPPVAVATSALHTPQGVALDGSGNLYIGDTGHNRALKEDYADAPSLSFATTAFGATSSDSPQIVTIENIGNAALSESGSVTQPPDFDLANGTTCNPSATSLAAGASCNLGIGFNPWHLGILNESLTLTDDNLNVAGSTQTIQFSGTGDPGPVHKLVVSAPGAVVAYSPFSLTVTAEDAYNNVVTSYAGTVSFSTSDPAAPPPVVLPAPYAFQAGDSGVHIFSGVTLATAGSQTITANDSGNSVSGTSGNVLVIPATSILTMTAGTPQAAYVNTAFATPLTVKVSSGGSPIAGATVNFAAPGSQASATLSAPSCVTDGTGSCSVTATANAVAGSYQATASVGPLTAPFSLTNKPFGLSQNIGSPSAAQAVMVSIVRNGALNAINVLTEGSPSLDFADAGGGTCSLSTSYTAGQTCTVDVTFTPKYPGDRFGAVVLVDGSGNILGETLIDPIGTGPQIVFEPGQESALPLTGSPTPYALAVDGAGDVFVSDGAGNQVIKETFSGGSYTPSTVATGFSGVRGVAVDGAGNLYVADYSGKQLYEVPWSGSAYGASVPLLTPGTYSPAGVAVDGLGNVYFTNFTGSDGNVYEFSGGSVTTLPNVMGLTQALGLALDASGNLFVSDYSGNKVVELPWMGNAWGSLIPAITTGLINPARIAVDGAESIYVADSGNNRVVRAPYTGSNTWGSLVTEQSSTLNSPQAVALDSAGNIYIADSNNHRVLKEDRADPPSLSFDNTPATWPSGDSPRTIQALNIGNANLVFTAVNYPTDFPENAPDLNLCSTSTPLLPGATCDLSMSFIPTYAGSFSENLLLTDNNLNAPSATQDIGLSGAGTPQPTAMVAPSSASFADTVQGTTANAWTFTLNNTSNLNLIGIAMSFTGTNPSNFAIAGSSCGTTLPPYSTCTFEVTFTPSITGNASDYYSANLVVQDDAVGHPQVIPVSGRGIAMNVLLNPNPVSFGTQTAGGTSGTQTAILANANSGTLTISGIGTSGAQAGAFNIVGTTCGPLPIPGGGVTLGPNQSCTITMNFTPNSNAYYSATLTVWDNGLGGQQSVTLNGQGQGQTVLLSPTSVNFSNQTVGSTSNAWTVTFNNTSDQSVTGVGVSIGGASADFAETNNCGSTLAAHSTCNILVTFTPQSATYFSATLQVTSSAGPQTASLGGTGTAVTATLAPDQLNFGSVPQNTTSPAQAATLTNTSGGPLTINGISVTADSAEFAIGSNGCVSPLAAHATCQIFVTYTPQNVGNSSGTLTVNDSATGSPQTVSLVGVGTSTAVSGFLSPGAINFGAQTEGSTSNAWGMTLNNTSSTAMTGLTIYTSGSNGGDFAETNTCGASLAAHSTCSIQVVFKPTATGSRSGTLIAAYTSGGGGSFSAGLAGVGVAPTVSLSPTSVNFGNQTTTVTSAAQMATLTNSSAGPVSISGVAVTSGAPFFALSSNTCGSTLAAYSSCAIGITFTPQTAIYYSGTLTITDSASGGQQTLNLNGTGTSNTPSGYFSPSSISFGNQTVGSTSNAWGVTLNNSSSIAMTGLVVSIGGGGNPGDFHIVNSNCGTTLGANATCSFQVTFTPQAINYRAGTLTATFTAGAGGTIIAPLTGNGIAPTVAVAPGSLNFGNVAYGNQTGDRYVTLSNTSVGILSGISYTAGNGSFYVDAGASNCGATLAANSSCTIAVYFKPAGASSYNGTLTIYDSASGGQQTVGLSGSGQLAAQTITFNPPSSPVTFGIVPIPLAATSTSGLTVTFSVVSGPGHVSGNSLVVTGAGTIVVAANQGGDSNYSPAPQVTQTVVVNKETPTVTTWPVASAIAYGQPLSASTLSGGVGPGAFSWTSPGTMPAAGVVAESVTFTPTDSADYSTVTNNVSVTVNKVTPSINLACYNNPITYLPGATQTATCTVNVGGGATGNVTFYWKPQSALNNNLWETVPLTGGSASLVGFNGLTAGAYVIEADYAGDSNNSPASATTNEVISPATPAVTAWPTASGITAGQALSTSVLSGGAASVPGTFQWTDGTILPGTGTDTESVTFLPTDGTDYLPVMGTAQVTVTDPPAALIHSSTYSLLANPTALTLRAGQSGTVMLSLVPLDGYQGTVSLSCPSLPSGVTCSFTSNHLTADGHNSIQTSQLTISTVGLAASASLPGDSRTGGNRALAGMLLLPGLFFGSLLAWRRKKLAGWARQLLVIGMLGSALAGFMGCGGSSALFTNTLTGTHSITLAAQATSATAGSTSTQTGNLTLTITQ